MRGAPPGVQNKKFARFARREAIQEPEELDFWRKITRTFVTITDVRLQKLLAGRSCRSWAMVDRGYRTARLETLHKTASALRRIGALDKATMRDLDAFCLTPVQPVSGEDIQIRREREGISQAVLARHMNVGTKLVSDWERGVKRPSGPSLKLLLLARAKGLDAIA
jgi:putative transcriptional regulator